MAKPGLPAPLAPRASSTLLGRGSVSCPPPTPQSTRSLPACPRPSPSPTSPYALDSGHRRARGLAGKIQGLSHEGGHLAQAFGHQELWGHCRQDPPPPR